MPGPLFPYDESGRLRALNSYSVLDTPREQAFDDLANLAAIICNAPIATVSLVAADRLWFKATYGLEVRQAPREHAICAHAILNGAEVMVVPDTLADERFCANPMVTGPPHVRFYAGAPLVTRTGDTLGTLCVMDQRPRLLTDSQLGALRALARQVVAQLELRRSLRELEVHRDSMKRAQALLEHQTITDSLTGIANRRALEARLQAELARSRRERSTLALAMIDADHFKAYNDGFGHPAGDEALRQLAKLLTASVRPYDFVARYGGEEFAAVFPSVDERTALVLAERMRQVVETARWPHRPLTISVGIAVTAPTRGEELEATELLERADRALYRAKDEGRNRVWLAPSST